MINRASTNLTRFFGAEIAAQLSGGRLANVARRGTGNERPFPADIRRLTTANLVPSTINTEEYHVALAFVQATKAAPNTQEAIAAAFVDVARILNVSVSQLISITDEGTLRNLEKKGILFLNQLRDNTSRLGKASTADNSKSLVSHEIAPFIRGRDPAPFDWAGGCFRQIQDPPEVVSNPSVEDRHRRVTRRVDFSGDGKWFATRNVRAGDLISIYDTDTWETAFVFGQELEGDFLTALEFHPRDPILVAGTASTDPNRGLRVYNYLRDTEVPNSPSFSRVNWAGWSPGGEYLAVIHTPFVQTDKNSITRLTVLRRRDWEPVFETQNNEPIRPIRGAWSPNGERFALYGNAGNLARVAVFNTETWSVVRNRDVVGGNIAYFASGPSIEFLHDNRTIIIPPNSEFRPSDVYRYDYISNDIQLVPISLGLTYSATATPDGRYVIVTGTGGKDPNPDATLSVISTETWEELDLQSFPDVDLIIDSAFSPDGRWLALANGSPGPDNSRPLIYQSTGCAVATPTPTSTP